MEVVTTPIYPISSGEELLCDGPINLSVVKSPDLRVVRIGLVNGTVKIYGQVTSIAFDRCDNETFGNVLGVNSDRINAEFLFTVAKKEGGNYVLINATDDLLDELEFDFTTQYDTSYRIYTFSDPISGKTIPYAKLYVDRYCLRCGHYDYIESKIHALTNVEDYIVKVEASANSDVIIRGAEVEITTFESYMDGSSLVLIAKDSGTFIPSKYGLTSSQTMQYLLVGGGGPGGRHGGGGGSAGGYRIGSMQVPDDNTAVTIGQGGCITAQDTLIRGTPGGDSTFNGIVAYGGVGGGSANPSYATYRVGASGPSGSGGCGYGTSKPAGGIALNLSPKQGYDGGAGWQDSSCYSGGGGGGGSQNGQDAVSDVTGGKGGDGISSSITGTLKYYCGGGGGRGGCSAGTGGLGGSGVGGTGSGGFMSANKPATRGAPNTGSGGGGGANDDSMGYPPAGGGSGVLILRVDNYI